MSSTGFNVTELGWKVNIPQIPNITPLLRISRGRASLSVESSTHRQPTSRDPYPFPRPKAELMSRFCFCLLAFLVLVLVCLVFGLDDRVSPLLLPFRCWWAAGGLAAAWPVDTRRSPMIIAGHSLSVRSEPAPSQDTQWCFVCPPHSAAACSSGEASLLLAGVCQWGYTTPYCFYSCCRRCGQA